MVRRARTARIAKRALLALALVSIAGRSAKATPLDPWGLPIEPAPRASQAGWAAPPAPQADAADPREGYDVVRYEIEIAIDPPAETISGRSRIVLRAQEALASVRVDLVSTLGPLEASLDGTPLTVRRLDDDQIDVDLPTPIAAEEEIALTIVYGGTPGASYFSGFQFFSRHGEGTGSFPVVSTLSQPYRSHAWWPCKERMDDKAPVRLRVGLPEGYVVAGNGNRIALEREGATTWTTWETAYPTSPYLVMLAATDYAVWEERHRTADGDSIPLVFFAYPEDEAKARIDFAATRPILQAFEAIFGPYPFRDRAIAHEKLGVAEFSWRTGAMEHQTCVSYGSGFVTGDRRNDWALAHEIAHQWWGDAVTPADMDHIWLSEGFATYAEALFLEASEGREAYMDWLRGPRTVPSFADETSSLVGPGPAHWFSKGLTYHKGAWVLHMLRQAIGDSLFFASLSVYAERHRHASARTEDFVRACEETARRDLSRLLHPWLYASGRPTLAWDWRPVSASQPGEIRLLIEQTQPPLIYRTPPPNGTMPECFTFPIEVVVRGERESSTTILWVDSRREVFRLPPVGFAVREILLDRDRLLLRELLDRGVGLGDEAVQVSPNPASGPVEILLLAAGPSRLAIHDLSGRLVRTFPRLAESGPHAIRWSGDDDAGRLLPAGVYFLQLKGERAAASARIVIAR